VTGLKPSSIYLYSTIGQLSSNQRHLATRRTKGFAVQIEPFPQIEPQAFDGLGKTLREQVGKRTLTTHPGTKATVIKLTATALSNQAQDMRCPLRVVGRQPLFE